MPERRGQLEPMLLGRTDDSRNSPGQHQDDARCASSPARWLSARLHRAVLGRYRMGTRRRWAIALHAGTQPPRIVACHACEPLGSAALTSRGLPVRRRRHRGRPGGSVRLRRLLAEGASVGPEGKAMGSPCRDFPTPFGCSPRRARPGEPVRATRLGEPARRSGALPLRPQLRVLRPVP